MGARKAGEQHIRNITQNSTGTYQVSLPNEMVAGLKWRQGQKVIITRSGKKLLISDWE